MRYLWQAILHRWYMGYWPTPQNAMDVPSVNHIGLYVQDEQNWGPSAMDQYIDPIIHKEINKLLADILEE